MWHRSIPVSSLAAYAAAPEAFCRAAIAPRRGRLRAIALGVLALVAVTAALALTGHLPLARLLDDAPLETLRSLVQRS